MGRSDLPLADPTRLETCHTIMQLLHDGDVDPRPIPRCFDANVVGGCELSV